MEYRFSNRRGLNPLRLPLYQGEPPKVIGCIIEHPLDKGGRGIEKKQKEKINQVN
jgi:hypothetical protein